MTMGNIRRHIKLGRKTFQLFIHYRDLMEELVPYIREAVDRKQENMRRRRRRDALRLQLVRVLELIAEYGTFGIWLVDILSCLPVNILSTDRK